MRLKYAYYITCKEVVKDENGEVGELICTYDPESRGGDSPDGRKVKGTIQWVDARSAIACKVNLYDRLFSNPNPEDREDGKDFVDCLNPESLEIVESALVEPSIQDLEVGEPMQLERVGYFCIDSDHAENGSLVLNRSVAMRDSWAKKAKK